MKRLIVVVVIAVVCTTLSYKSLAQTSFAGTVKFETKYEGETNPQKHIPSETTYTIFENKKKWTTVFRGINIYIIQDGDALTKTVLVDVPQGRLGYVDDKEAIEEELLKKTCTYTERTDTKNICGYECKGYDIVCVIMNEDEDEEEEETEIKIIVYTTNEIGKNDNINAIDNPELSGFPLYTEMEKDGVKTIIQAKEIKKTKVKNVDFLVPSDYKMVKDEYKAGLKQTLGL